MTGERLVVELLTAHRLDYAVETAYSTAANLRHAGPLSWHIADDGDDDNYIGAVADAIRQGGGYAPVSRTQAGGRGYGASHNLAMQVTHGIADMVLVLEDDWRLARPLDTASIVRMLAVGGRQDKQEWQWAVEPPDGFTARSVRLGYLGFQWPLTMHLFKTDESLWAALDPASPEQHVATGHPRIETVAYQRDVGPWPESLNPGATELGWCQLPAARQGVVWPLSLVALTGSISGNMFEHIGSIRSYD